MVSDFSALDAMQVQGEGRAMIASMDSVGWVSLPLYFCRHVRLAGQLSHLPLSRGRRL